MYINRGRAGQRQALSNDAPYHGLLTCCAASLPLSLDLHPSIHPSMGSVGVEEDAKAAVEAFLQRCAPSGDAAYAELRALLARLHDPATRRQERVFLAALRRRQQSSSPDDRQDFFRRFGFRIQELLLHDNAVAASAFRSAASSPGIASSLLLIDHSLSDEHQPIGCYLMLFAHRSLTSIILISQSGARALPTDRSLSACKLQMLN